MDVRCVICVMIKAAAGSTPTQSLMVGFLVGVALQPQQGAPVCIPHLAQVQGETPKAQTAVTEITGVTPGAVQIDMRAGGVPN